MPPPVVRSVLLLGDGGFGKTSAGLALVHRCIAEREAKPRAPWETPQSEPPSTLTEAARGRRFAVFISLPSVPGALTERGALLPVLRQQLNLGPADLTALRQVPVLVVLDALDEVQWPRAHPAPDVLQHLGIDWESWADLKVVVTCRGQWMERWGVSLSDICGEGRAHLKRHVQPFGDEETQSWLRRQAELRGVAPQALFGGLRPLLRDAPAIAHSPLHLSLAITALPSRNTSPGARWPDDVDPVWWAYDAWLRGYISAKGLPRRCERLTKGGAPSAELVQLAVDYAVRLAAVMAEEGRWRGRTGDDATTLSRSEWLQARARRLGLPPAELSLQLLGSLPLRNTNVGERTSEFSFTHRSLQEFLLARQVLGWLGVSGGDRVSISFAAAEVGMRIEITPCLSGQPARERAVGVVVRKETSCIFLMWEGPADAMTSPRGDAAPGMEQKVERGWWDGDGQPTVVEAEADPDDNAPPPPMWLRADRDGGSAASWLPVLRLCGRWARLSGDRQRRLAAVVAAAAPDAPPLNLSVSSHLPPTGPPCLSPAAAAASVLAAAGSRALAGMEVGVGDGDGAQRRTTTSSQPLCDMRGAVLRDAVLCGAQLRECDLRGADFCGAALRGAVLRSCDLTGATFGVLPGAESGGAVRCVARAGDGPAATVIAAAVRGRAPADPPTVVMLWDLNRPQLVGPVCTIETTHTDAISTIAISEDGRTLLTASYDRLGMLWSLGMLLQRRSMAPGDTAPTGAPLGVLKGHTDTVRAAALSGDGRWAGTASWDGTARVWAARDHHHSQCSPRRGEVHLGVCEPHLQPIRVPGGARAVAFTPDGELLAVGAGDGTARLFTVVSHLERGPALRGRGRWVVAVGFSPDGATLVAGSSDGTVRLWDTAAGEALSGHLEGHSDGVSSIAFSPDGREVLTGSLDCTARRWVADTGEPVGEPLSGHSAAVTCVAYGSERGVVTKLVTGCADGAVRAHPPTVREVADPPRGGHTGAVTAAAFAPRGAVVLTGSDDGTARAWSAVTGEQLGAPLRHKTQVPRRRSSMRRDSRRASETLRRRSSGLSRSQLHESAGRRGITAVAWSPSGAFLVTGSGDRTAQVWDWPTCVPSCDPLVGHQEVITAVAWSPDKRLIATASRDRTVQLWHAPGRDTELATGGRYLIVSGHAGAVNGLAFLLPRGRFLCTASADHTAHVWAVADSSAAASRATAFPPSSAQFPRSPMAARGLSPRPSQSRLISPAFPSAGSPVFPAAGSPIGATPGSFSRPPNLGSSAAPGSFARTPNLPPGSPSMGSGPGSPGARPPMSPTRNEVGGHRGLQIGTTQATINVRSPIASPRSPYGAQSTQWTDPRGAPKPEGKYGEKTGPLNAHSCDVATAAASPDGKWLATGADDGTIQVWSAGGLDRVGGLLMGHTKGFGITSLAFSSDSKLLASGSIDCTAQMWSSDPNAKQRKLGPPMRAHTGAVTAVAFSPSVPPGCSGLLLATASRDCSIRLWQQCGSRGWLPIALLSTAAEGLQCSGAELRGCTFASVAKEVALRQRGALVTDNLVDAPPPGAGDAARTELRPPDEDDDETGSGGDDAESDDDVLSAFSSGSR